MLFVEGIPTLVGIRDNYVWVLRHAMHQKVYVIDPGEAAPVQAFLQEHRLEIEGIIVTHQHWDHVNGITDLVEGTQIPVFGPFKEQVAQVNHPLKEGGSFKLWQEIDVELLETPGHMPDHISYFFTYDEQAYLFCGDTLFSCGCGRLLGGTAEELLSSLTRLGALPSNTAVYPAHEYTLSNLKFALGVEPNNSSISKEIQRVTLLREDGLPSLPSTIDYELRHNPFLRCSQTGIQKGVEGHYGKALSSELEVFAALRLWKDGF